MVSPRQKSGPPCVQLHTPFAQVVPSAHGALVLVTPSGLQVRTAALPSQLVAPGVHAPLTVLVVAVVELLLVVVAPPVPVVAVVAPPLPPVPPCVELVPCVLLLLPQPIAEIATSTIQLVRAMPAMLSANGGRGHP
jgi:hypothetical protein